MAYPPLPGNDGFGIEMRDLLIRLDQKVEDGLADIKQDFTEIRREQDAIKTRVGTIESELGNRPLLIQQHTEVMKDVSELKLARLTSEARLDGAKTATRFLWSALALVVSVLGYVGYRVEIAPQPVTATHTTTERITVPVTQP